MTVEKCPVCADLRLSRSARGPAGIRQRVVDLLERVHTGELTELAHAHSLPWSAVPPDQLVDDLVMAGGGIELRVESEIAVRCTQCLTTFRQCWTFDRGNERWIIESW